MNKSIILLSGGLDSLVCLGLCHKTHNIELAITFDYGQKSVKHEIEASKKLTEYYHINHEVIELPFLAEITNNSLTTDDELPTQELFTKESAQSVWVPNRNGLFLNIAASYADSYNFSHIIIGANRDEAKTFPDNSKEFVQATEEMFKYSTIAQPKVYTPLINYSKNDIVALALENNMPLELTRSCYDNSQKNCGICESCTHLKKALKYNNAEKYIEDLFENVD